MFVCLSVNFFFIKDFSATTWVRILKFGTKLDSDELYPRYEVYRGYIVFAFSVIKFVCLSVNIFFHQRFLSNYLG